MNTYIASLIHNIDGLCNIYFLLVVFAAFTDVARNYWYTEMPEKTKEFLISCFILSIVGMIVIPDKEALAVIFQ